jgi:hypothetical protein
VTIDDEEKEDGSDSGDISPDGQRLLMVEKPRAGTAATQPAQLRLVLNWSEELKQRVPTT